MATARLDWKRIATWEAALVSGDIAPVARGFAEFGAHPPDARWAPEAEGLAAAPLRFLAGFWAQIAPAPALPHPRHIDPFALRPALGYLMLLEPVDQGSDFRYRLFGSAVAEISGYDMTGRLASEQPASIYVTEFSVAAYRAVLARRTPLYTERRPMGAERTTRWQRIALPFADDSGAVVRVLAGTVPIGVDGRIIG